MELKQQAHPLLVRTLGREPTREEVAAWNKLPGFKGRPTEVTYVVPAPERLQ